MKFIAHIRKKDKKEQSVLEHVLSVSQIAAANASKIGLSKAGELIGLLHDFGKYSKAFQNYIGSATELIRFMASISRGSFIKRMFLRG